MEDEASTGIGSVALLCAVWSSGIWTIIYEQPQQIQVWELLLRGRYGYLLGITNLAHRDVFATS